MTLFAEFERRYIPEPNSGCWLWTSTSGRYGTLYFKGRNYYAHRLSWELHRGPIPDGQCVCHRCDVTCCVNPDHLFIGTNDDNVADMITKRRHCWGVRNGRATIDGATAQAILDSPGTYKSIAARFDVSWSVVCLIKGKRSWASTTTGGPRQNGYARGEKVPSAKLTADQVRAIRADPRSSGAVAPDYGIQPRQVRRIRSGERWGHLS